jgi:hypothetical protein
MSIKRTVAGLAAAVTLVVAGTALGQGSPVTGTNYGVWTKAGAATNKFTVSTVVAAPAAPTITTTANTKPEHPILSFDATTVGGTDAEKDTGNIGIVKIVCKHARFDVLMFAKNGGKLVKPGSGSGASAVPAATLQKATVTAPTTKTDAILGVQLTIRQPTTVAGKTAFGYYTPVTIPTTAVDEANAVAFSQLFFATAYDATRATPDAGFELVLGDAAAKLTGSDPLSVKTAGFLQPATTDNSINFGVSAGLGISGANILAGNGAGTYSEEISFLVYAGSY